MPGKRTGAQRKKAARVRQRSEANGDAMDVDQPVRGSSSTSSSDDDEPDSPEIPQASTSKAAPPFSFPSSNEFTFDVEAKLTDAEKALRRKDAGNVAFKERNYIKAIGLYNEACQLAPSDPVYLNNLAAAKIELKRYAEARDDVLKVIALQANSPEAKAYARLGKAQLQIGDFKSAERSLQRALELEPGNKSATADWATLADINATLESIERDRSRGETAMIGFGLDKLQRLVYSVPIAYKLYRVEAMLAKKPTPDLESAILLVNDLFRLAPRDPDTIYWRGRTLMLDGQIEQAIKHWRQVIVLDCDHAPAKAALSRAKKLEADKAAGTAAFKTGDYAAALESYSSALSADDVPKALRVILLSNRAAAHLNMKSYEQAVADCDACLQLDSTYVKALRTRAKASLKTEDYEGAVRDFKAAFEAADDTAMRTTLRNELRGAEVDLKRSKTKDWYKVLDVAKDASELEIKKAYRQASLRCHPDKGGSEAQFQEVGEAYSILSDPQKRAHYDRGGDDGGTGMNGFDGFGGGGHPFASHFGGGSPFGGGGFASPGFSFEDLFSDQAGGGPSFRSSRSRRPF